MWNTPAIVLLIAAFIAFGIVFATGEALAGNSDVLAGVATIVGAGVFIAGDLLYYRRGDDPSPGKWRWLSPDSGASISLVPGWIIGLVGVGCGVVLIVQGLR